MLRIELLCLTPDLVAELADDRFEAARHVSIGELKELIKCVAQQSEEYRRKINAPPEWCGYLAIDAEEQLVVGTCAFKGPPDAKGVVEIAYFTMPPYEGRGYATLMASALFDRAQAASEVRCVCAHTAPEPNASTRILEKLGFTFRGPIDDPEDGHIWRWEREVVRA